MPVIPLTPEDADDLPFWEQVHAMANAAMTADLLDHRLGDIDPRATRLRRAAAQHAPRVVTQRDLVRAVVAKYLP